MAEPTSPPKLPARAKRKLFWYQGVVAEDPPHDGDTIDVYLDLGFGIGDTLPRRFRLWGIDAPEVGGPRVSADEKARGRVARDWLRSALPAGQPVIVRSYLDKQEKYGRWLAEVFAPLPDTPFGPPVNLNRQLVESGMAEQRMYGDKFVAWSTLTFSQAEGPHGGAVR